MDSSAEIELDRQIKCIEEEALKKLMEAIIKPEVSGSEALHSALSFVTSLTLIVFDCIVDNEKELLQLYDEQRDVIVKCLEMRKR